MNKLKIPENNSGETKTLRIPSDIVKKIDFLASKKNISFNKAVIEFLKFGLENLDDEDKKIIDNMKK
ncbi:MAG: hypothetical protein J6B87_02755 [Clostridia bacterium]|nr:hypothetical protein [Clostridia bacterium]